MKIIAVIPVKLNNKRLPNKNIKKFDNGRYVLSYIFNTLLKIPELKDIYVYCSDERIKKYLPSGIKFLKRDAKYDSDFTKMNEILKSFAKKIKSDVYLLTHITSPFIKSTSIQEGIKRVSTNKYDSAFSAKPMQEFIWKDGKPFNYDLKRIPRSQDLPELLIETCGFYIFKRNIIINNNCRIGNKPYIVKVDNIESIDINNYEDFKLANLIASSLKD